MIRPASHGDAAAIAAIYNHYIEHTVVSFEESPIGADEIVRRMGEVEGPWPWFVALHTARDEDGVAQADTIIGFAYAGQWSGRDAYRNSAEMSVYLAHDHVARGVGSALYARLLEELRSRGIHTVIGGVALPNPASIALHERFGFQKAAHYKEVGYKFGRWIDVAYWQLMLVERDG